MKKTFTLLAVLIIAFSSTLSREIYVAKNGDDGNPGTINEPYLTLLKAADQAYPGDTILIREGLYTETLQLPRSGTSGNPITIMGYPGEKIVINAMEPLSGWTLDEGSVYKTDISWDLGQQNFVMFGDTACDLARWPNNTDRNLFTLNSLRNTGGSTAEVASNAYLDYTPGIPDYDWSKGGSVFFYCDMGGSGWIAWKSFIKSNTTTRLVFDLNKNPDWIRTMHYPAALGDFFLEGIREVLDYENEWYFEESSGILYIQLPGGAEPADSTVYMRKRTHTINLQDRNYIILKNLEAYGGSIEISGNYNHIYGIKSRWGNHHRGIMSFFSTNTQSVLLDGSYNIIEKCDIGYGAGTGVRVAGSYNKVLNNFIHNFNFLGSYDAPARIRDGSYTTLSHNTITRGGRDCISMNHTNSTVSYNDVSHSNLIADDCGLFYTVGGPYNTTIHHNWFHDTRSRGNLHKAAGIYLDNDGEGFIVHHNVVWNTEWASIQINKDGKDIDVFNNTFLDGSTAMGAWHKEGTQFENVRVYNNLANNTGFEEQADQQNNLTVYDDPFVNSSAKDFQLKAGTEPIDYGRQIAGITEGFVGSSPDAGAYEYGGEKWTAGIDWNPSAGPDDCLEDNIYEEVDGILIVEAESAAVYGAGWKLSDSIISLGSGYLEYTGPDHTSSMVASAASTYQVKISNPGTYRLMLLSRNGPEAAAPDQQNSSWLHIEGDEFYGSKQENKIILDSNFASLTVQSMDSWTWENSAEYDGQDSLKLFVTFNYSGIYTITIAGRSSGHIIDRFVLFQEGREALATDSTAMESWTGCDEYTIENQWASPKLANAEYFSNEFVIDGILDDDWESLPEYTGAFSINDEELPAGSDLSYTFRMAFNDSALCLFAYIRDDVLSRYTGEAGNYEAFDNLELFLNPDNSHQTLGRYGDDAIQIRLNYGVDHFLSIGNGDWKASDHDGFECISLDTAGGYILEARIPWKGVLPAGMEAGLGSVMGFEIQVNDRDLDPEISSTVSWANNTGIDISLYDTRKFGTLALVKGTLPVSVTGVEIGLDTLVLEPGQILTLAATILPDDASNKTVTWKALDPLIVNVTPTTGIAKGNYPGTTVIVATTQDGAYTDTITIIVLDPNAPTGYDDLSRSSDADIMLVPNPASGSFRIIGLEKWTEIQVHSITGELMLNLRNGNSEEDIQIDLVPAGLYLVKILAEDAVYLKKIIKIQ